jgi:hypothetical protein
MNIARPAAHPAIAGHAQLGRRQKFARVFLGAAKPLAAEGISGPWRQEFDVGVRLPPIHCRLRPSRNAIACVHRVPLG